MRGRNLGWRLLGGRPREPRRLIGDGIAGEGVERAWESGLRLAQAILQSKEELAL